MYTLKVENEYGEMLELTHNTDYTVTNIQGLNPPSANINTAVVASFDGSRYNSSRMQERNLVITVVIENEIEKNRINLYKYFKPKKLCKLYYSNNSRDVYIEGYVESFEVSQFDQRQTAQISVLCPDPFFKALTEMVIDFTSVTSMFYFPFAIEESGIPFSEQVSDVAKPVINDGDVESGMIITLHADGEVANPALYNVDTRESLKLNLSMVAGDTVTINTNPGQKSVILNRSGVNTNIINKVVRGSTWLQIDSGANTFTYEADSGVTSLTVAFQHVDKFEGV